MPKKEKPEPLWTHQEAAEYLGIPEKSLYEMARKGTGPPSFRVGKYRRYDHEDLRQWLKAQRTPGVRGMAR